MSVQQRALRDRIRKGVIHQCAIQMNQGSECIRLGANHKALQLLKIHMRNSTANENDNQCMTTLHPQ